MDLQFICALEGMYEMGRQRSFCNVPSLLRVYDQESRKVTVLQSGDLASHLG